MSLRGLRKHTVLVHPILCAISLPTAHEVGSMVYFMPTRTWDECPRRQLVAMGEIITEQARRTLWLVGIERVERHAVPVIERNASSRA